MRLFRVLSLLSLLFGGACASSLDSREPAPPDVRDVLDVCASVDTELVVPDLQGMLTAIGELGGSHFFPIPPSI